MITGSDWGGSRLIAAQTCKQLYFNRYIREHPTTPGIAGIVRREDSPASSKGSLVHVGLQHYYKRLIEEPDGDKRKFILEGIYKANEAMTKFNLPETIAPLIRDEVMACLDQYFQNYNLNNEMQPLAVEKEVSFKILDKATGHFHVHTGIVDLIAKWHDALFVVDHKTTSMTFDQLYGQYAFSLSFRGYALAVAEEYGEPLGVLVNAIRFKKNKALECEFQREPFMYSREDLADIPRTVISIKREIKMCETDGFWPKSSSQCVKPWGKCEYYQLCKYDDPAMVNALYRPAPTKADHEEPTLETKPS